MWFTRVSINNPVFATMMMAAIMVLGLFSYQRLPVEQMPDIAFPVAVIQTPYPGAGAQAVEQDVSRPIEEAINTINGIKTIRSNSREGVSFVVAEFELNVDIKTAIQDVRDKVAEARRGFNRDIGEPTVTRADNENDQPLIYLSMQSDARSLRELSDLADRLIIKRLQGANGVGNIQIDGDVQRELAIMLKPEKMAAYGVGIDQITNAIRTENQDAPSGALVSDTNERLVRVLGKLRSVQDFERIIVARRGSGTTSAVTLGQLAEIKDGKREETSIATENGKRVISIQIRKTRGANTIDMAEAIRKQIEELKKSLPPDIKLQITFDRSVFIKDGVDNVRHTILEGALLTVLIVFLFLHSWRSTVITGLKLPISVFAAFIALYAFGFTLNFLTLMALSLSIGILIDDAIVVRENIVRHLAMGKSHRQAALEATEEIGLAVMATTFSLIAVFLSVAFMGGIIGKFFYQFGITVVVAVVVSLFVSFTLDPMLSSVWHDGPSSWMNRIKPIKWALDKQQLLIDWLHARYDLALRWSLAHRKSTLGIAAAIFVGSFFLMPFIGSEFVPQDDDGYTNLRIQTPIGSSLDYSNAKAEQVEAALADFPEIKRVSKTVNKSGAWFDIQLSPKSERARSQKQIDDEIRKRLAQIAGLEVNIGWNRPIQLYILGPDINELDRISKQVMAKMKTIKGMVDIESTFKPTSPTLDVVVNRELASDLGVSMGQITATTKAMIGGEQAGQWQGPDGENHQILVRLPKDERTGVADLDKLYVASYSFNADATPRMVPLRQVVDFKPAYAERQIERRNLQRQIRLNAGVANGANVGDVAAELRESIKGISLPPGYRFQYGGSSQDMQESLGYAIGALGLAIIFIYLILASQFGSYLQPLAIMASLPLSLVGVFLALLIFGSTLNLFSVIGFIMLMGLVTKNAILLVDFTNQGIREGKTREQAILDAGQVRLRPILMTTAAMIGGMMPLALAFGAGSEQQSPMAHAVIGGIITSTILTLVVVPVLYTYFDTWGRQAKAWLAAKPAGGSNIAALPAREKRDD